jgi:hypothetical protein
MTKENPIAVVISSVISMVLLFLFIEIISPGFVQSLVNLIIVLIVGIVVIVIIVILIYYLGLHEDWW